MSPAPSGYTSVTPWLALRDAAGFLDFTAAVFGAREAGRAPGPDGLVGHAETRIGDAVLMVAEAREGWAVLPASLRVHVDDVVGVLERATDAGARVVTPPTALPVGELAAHLADPWGNLWWVHQRVDAVDVTELVRRMADPAVRAAMAAYEDSLDAELRRRASTGPLHS